MSMQIQFEKLDIFFLEALSYVSSNEAQVIPSG